MKIKIKDFFKNHYLIILIIFLAVVAHCFFFFDWYEVWWDSGVYIGMGKFIFSLGKAGVWEHIRPVAWPFILGGIWKLGLPVVLFGRIVEFLMYLSSVFLIYLIGRKVYSKPAGLIAAALLASSAILFHLVFHLYTEIPAMFFTLLSYFLFLRKNYFFAGLSIAAAFLTKFPAAIFGVILFFALIFKKQKQWKNLLYFSIGAAVLIVPFLITNLIFYGSIFGGLLAAQLTIKKVLGCNVLRKRAWHYYFFLLIVNESKFLLASILGLFNKFKKNLLIIFSAVLPLLYFMNLSCRDYRYVVVFLPFIALLAGAGLVLLIDKLKTKKFKVLFLIILIIAVSFLGYKKAFFFYSQEKYDFSKPELEYFDFLHGKQVSGEIWTSNPVLSAYSDNLLHKIYYPVYDENVSTDFFNYLQNNSNKIEYIFLDNCGGGIICHPDDNVCKEKNNELIEFLDNNFNKIFDKQQGNCWYKIYNQKTLQL